MRFIGILTLLFLLPLSAAAGTFLETFDNKELEGWQELVQLNKVPALWEIVNGELEVVNREPSLYFLTTGDKTWEDYTVEFDVKTAQKARYWRYRDCCTGERDFVGLLRCSRYSGFNG